MTLKEYAEKEGISLKEAKAITGLTHWKQEVPESCDEIPEVIEKIVEVIKEEAVEVVEEVLDVEPEVALEVIELALRCLGNKSKYWHLRHLLK